MKPINDAQRAMTEPIAAYGPKSGIKPHLVGRSSAAPIRNPWEVTFGLPGVNGSAQASRQPGSGKIINWFQSASLKLNNSSESVAPATARDVGSKSSGRWSEVRSWHWPAMYNDWRSPAIDRGAERRGYIDSHYVDPNTGASVSSRHRFKRSVSEMTQAMASAAPQEGFGGGAPDAWASTSRLAPMLAAQT